jgi:hypothetical protein
MFDISKLKMSAIPISPKIEKATGEITPIAFVSEAFKIKENMKPIISIEVITPKVIIQLYLTTLFGSPSSSSEVVPARYAKNPG